MSDAFPQPAPIDIARLEKLDRFRAMGDPLADAVAVDFATMPDRGAAMLNAALEQGIASVPNAPASLRALFAEIDHVPYWVDFATMSRASSLLLRANVFGVAVLACYSTPLFYRLGQGSRPLSITDALVSGAAQRGRATARFVVETAMPQGLRRDAEGFHMTIRIRMIHAQVRRGLLRAPGWDVAVDGMPVSQTYMAAMSSYLSAGWLHGLRMLGLRVAPEESEALMQLWRYSSHLMGVHPELLMATEQEAMRFIAELDASEKPPGEAAHRLMDALLEAVPSVLGMRGWRARYARRFFEGMARALLGVRSEAEFGLRATCWRHVPMLASPMMAGLRLLTVISPSAARRAQLWGTRLWLSIADYSDVDAPVALSPRR